MEKIVTFLGIAASIAMPLFNIPLVIKIIRRKSSRDLSLLWTFGVWICILGILPSSLMSADIVFRIFGIVNLVMFTAVVVTVMRYR